MEDLFLSFLIIGISYLILAVTFHKRLSFLSHPIVRLIWVNFHFSVLGVFCLFLLGEVYFRFIDDSTNSFALSKSSARWFERHSLSNLSGFRDSINYKKKISLGKVRVTFLGDSFTEGHGIPNVEERFVNLLRKKMPNHEIHSFARSGADTGEEIELLSSFIKNGYLIDHVVLVYCLNDISDLVPEWQVTLDQFYQTGWLKGIMRESFFLDFLYFRWMVSKESDIRNYYHSVLSHYRGKIWEAQKRRFSDLKILVEKNHGQLSVVILPFFHVMGPSYPYTEIHAMIRNAWATQGVTSLDLLPVFQGKVPQNWVVNRFDAHPNEAAHQVIADALGPFLPTN